MQQKKAGLGAGAGTGLDPITTKVLWDRLVSIVDEATAVQYRTAFSIVVQEANDFACSILDKEGSTLANSQFGLPSFVSTQAVTLHHFLKLFPVPSIRPGDVFITNYPWIATGQSMDITVLSPIFKGNRLLAFAGSVAHSPDLGGAQRWNQSTDIFADALIIPPLKLFDQGKPNLTFFEMLKANSRVPELSVGDLEAQLAATRSTTIRVLALTEEYGLDHLDDLVHEIYSRSERAMREAIRAVPDGTYVGEIWSDSFPDPLTDGPTQQDPILIRATVTVKDSDMSVDFEGSSPQRPGSFNSVWTFTAAYTLYALRMVLVPFFPNNAGFYKPIKVHCPSGTVVNASFPSATISRHAIGHQVADAVFAALAPAMPQAVFAQSGSAPSWDLLLMGEDARGRPYHRLVIINGGTGGGPRLDGISAAFPANLTNTPVEVMESIMPIVWECKELIEDSAGMGRHRGGFGQRMRLRALALARFSLINARVINPPQGLLGGLAGRSGRAVVRDEELPPGSDGVLRAGDTLTIETPGGGGLGPYLERDPVLVANDREEGLVSSLEEPPVAMDLP